MAVTYNTGLQTTNIIFTTTSGGIVFSSNLKTSTAFNYFSNTSVVNDAIYFSSSTAANFFSDITFNINTPFTATSYTIVWERFYTNTNSWRVINNCFDETNMFSLIGVKAFKFGGEFGWTKNTVNAVLGYWVRARITAVDTITSGGSNINDVITLKDGKVNIDGYTDAVPCTPEIVYQYLNTNYPWVGVIKTNNSYDFTNVQLWCNSRFFITMCVIETCLGGQYPGSSSFNYLRMGYKKDDYTGYNGGILLVKASPNSYPFVFSTNTQIYGSKLISTVTGAGYPQWFGEWIDSEMVGINFSPSVLGIIRNCRIEDPGTWIAGGGFPTVFDKNKVILTGSYFAYFYNGDVTISNLSWSAISTIYYFLYFYQTSLNVTFTFINPSPSLPGINTTAKILQRDNYTPANSFTKVFYYNSVTPSYTDYTTQFNDTTLNDAPICGEVGDCYYFLPTPTPTHSTVLGVTSTLGTNDYEYAWEYFSAGAWRSAVNFFDRTANMAITDLIYLSRSATYGWGSTTINGSSGYYIRARITKKGTGIKYITSIKWAIQTGCSDWNVWEKFTLDISIIDLVDSIIIGANVAIKLNDVSVYSGVTDSSGNIIQQPLVYRRWYFDPINSWNNWRQITEVIYHDYDLVISKAGYETYTTKIKMSEQRKLQVSLKPVKKIRQTIEGKLLLANQAEKGSSALLLEI